MIFRDRAPAAEVLPDTEELAAQAFARRRFGPWAPADESELKTRLLQDPDYADAFERVEQSWAAVGQHATSAELMGLREQAISRARRAGVQRWMGNGAGRQRIGRIAAGVAAVGILSATAYQFAPFGFRPGEYRTDIGEQRSIELADRTRIALDAATRLRVRYTQDSRIVQLIAGQAQFSVAKDLGRPFKVEAGDHTVVAMGTVFTVEYVDHEMHVAMLEGKVAVLPQQPQRVASISENSAIARAPVANAMNVPITPAPNSVAIELVAGEALHVRRDGNTALIPKADLEAATAWREGKVIFRSEPLGDAVRRFNRYSRLQLQIDDPTLASMNISGLFDAGDTAAFIEAIQSYLPVTADYSDSDTVRLTAR